MIFGSKENFGIKFNILRNNKKVESKKIKLGIISKDKNNIKLRNEFNIL